jgi:hypothetical protein
MFKRKLFIELQKWKQKKHRFPLIVRGARQTGKTTLIKEFGKSYKNFIYFNLEDIDSRKLFTDSFSETIRLIELKISQKLPQNETLLFLDEIQASKEAISLLRFFLEEMPDLNVICAGSLLEIKLSQKQISFPTGRVEYLFLAPMTFYEYLKAADKHLHLEIIFDKPDLITEEIHRTLMQEVYSYFQVGGMPAAIQHFMDTSSYAEVQHFHTNLYQSILDDIGKYLSKSESKYIELVFESTPFKLGERIVYGNFNNSGYRSREIKQAFEILQKAFLIYRVLPTSTLTFPPFHNLKKSPKIFYFDIGLANSRLSNPFDRSQITKNSGIRGHFAEQFVFQELLALNKQIPESLYFWARDKKNSHAEIDFCGGWKNNLIPIEVKSGSAGTLKSLGVFMERSAHKYALRFYSGLPVINRNVQTGKGPPFTLLNLPFYLAGRWHELASTEYFT